MLPVNGNHPRDASRVQARRIAGNLLRFGRRLRAAGMPLGSGQILDFVQAVEAVGIGRKDDIYSAAKSTLVSRPEQIPLFNAEFRRFWADLVEQQAPMFTEAVHGEDEESIGTPDASRKKQDEQGQGQKGGEADKSIIAVEGTEDVQDIGETEEYEVPPEDVLIFSASEALRKKDFAQFTPDELAEARRLIESMNWRLGTRLTRRKQRALHGEYIDFRATLRGAIRQGGLPLELKWRERKERMRPLVLICDISGSMDRYSRLLLRFVHALEHGLDSVEVFVFGTRLTRITRGLRKKNVDQAIADVVATVDDWSGGTRIGESIRNFNYRWSRRVLRSGATVVVISDGWDRGDPQLLGAEMARLQRSCRRVIWLNPLLGAPGYQPLTQGIRASLPYVDHFLPIHNLKSMEALAKLLGAVEDTQPVRRQVTTKATRTG
jgi:uncharacterized protein